MKQTIKQALHAMFPEWTTALMSARARAYSQSLMADWGCRDLNRKLIERFGPTVQEGPFAGMVLGPMAEAEHLGPYLLGVYESELDGAWDHVFRGTYTQIVDVGAKFGYYAVGLARRYPDVPVVAFDTDPWARNAVREMSAANRTGHVEVRGFCRPKWLAHGLRAGALVVCDCEGYESELFAEVTPALQSATLVIETHDCFVPGISDHLRDVFASSHRILTIGETPDRRQSALDLSFLNEAERDLANRDHSDSTSFQVNT